MNTAADSMDSGLIVKFPETQERGIETGYLSDLCAKTPFSEEGLCCSKQTPISTSTIVDN